MTQWEQIKSEYKNIPVPDEGSKRVLQAIGEAKEKRNRFKQLSKYATVAAAVLLVVILGPGMILFSGGMGAAKEDSAYLEMEYKSESAGADGGSFRTQGVKDEMSPATSNGSASKPPEAMQNVKAEADAALPAESPEYGLNEPDCFTAEEIEAISREIISQMEMRMREMGETYYIRSEENSAGFEQIAKDQPFYINGDGQLVIVFEAGMVAPIEQGDIEFIIPVSVAAP